MMEHFFNMFFSLIEKSPAFTNGYLWFQIILFVVMLTFALYKIFKEISLMNRLQPKLAELDKSLPAVELVRRINELISHEKKSKYTQQWQRYYERVSQKEEDEQIRTEPFFAPEVLLYHMGYRPWMDAGAGIHVSIGVLGTFIGLSAGLSRLNVMDPEALRGGIEGLISGMKIAFYTSVLGVFLSIVWILIDRMISKWLESHIDWHAERLDYLLNIDDEELFLNRLEKVSRSQADHLKTLLTDALEQAMRPVVHVLEAQLEQQKQNSQSMTEQLVAQVAGGTQQTVAQYVQVMQQTSQIQSAFMQTMEKVAERLSIWEEKQAAATDQTSRLYVQFQQISQEIEKMQEHYQQASQTMNQIGATFDTIGQLTAEQLPLQRDIIASQVALAEKYERLMDEVSRAHVEWDQLLRAQTASLAESERLLKQIQSVSSQLTPLAPVLQQTTHTLHEMANQVRQLQEMQKQLLPHLVNLRQETQAAVKEALSAIRQNSQQLGEQAGLMRRHWEQASQQFTATRQALDQSLKGFTENIDAGLQKTYHHFDQTLTMAVNHVSSMVEQLDEVYEDLIERLEDLGEYIKHMVSPEGSRP